MNNQHIRGLATPSQDDVEPILRARFIEAMGLNATSVTLITTNGPSGRFGMTVSAFNSVSAEPPTVLTCINRRSPAYGAISLNGKFAVNILNTNQTHISDSFAGRPRTGNPFDFDCCEWFTGETGVPLVRDSVASFECEVIGEHQVASHTVFLGKVVAVHSTSNETLLYSKTKYSRLSLV